MPTSNGLKMSNNFVRILVAFIVILFVLSAFPIWTQAAPYPFSGGSGTSSDPYQISTLEDLDRVRDRSSSYFILINDINASDTRNWNSGKGFIPLGSDSYNPNTFDYNYFNGNFNGAGYEISGLYINITNRDVVGLFSCINFNARVYNLTLTDVEVNGLWFVGALVGTNFGKVEDCQAYGTVGGENTVGGMVGWNNGELKTSNANVSTQGRDEVGGLVGYNPGLISNCYVYGDVYGRNIVGGLVGFNPSGGKVFFSVPFNNVSGSQYTNYYVGKNLGLLHVFFNGYINYRDGSPANNVRLMVDGTAINVFTNEEGFFSFWASGSVVQSGSMQLTAVKGSNEFDTLTITNANANYSPLEYIYLTGEIRSSDDAPITIIDEPSASDDTPIIIIVSILSVGGLLLLLFMKWRHI